MSDLATTPWLVCRLRRPDAAVRLYCFPHSGGSPGEFVRWDTRTAVRHTDSHGRSPLVNNRLGEDADPVTALRSVLDCVIQHVLESMAQGESVGQHRRKTG